jgi:hypothetical protein
LGRIIGNTPFEQRSAHKQAFKALLGQLAIRSELKTVPVKWVAIESVFSKTVQVIAWRETQVDSVWRRHGV